MKCFYFPEELAVALQSAFGLPFHQNFIKRHRRFNRGYITATLKKQQPPVASDLLSVFRTRWFTFHTVTQILCMQRPLGMDGKPSNAAVVGSLTTLLKGTGEGNMFLQPSCVKVSCVLAQPLQQRRSYTRHPLGDPRCDCHVHWRPPPLRP